MRCSLCAAESPGDPCEARGWHVMTFRAEGALGYRVYCPAHVADEIEPDLTQAIAGGAAPLEQIRGAARVRPRRRLRKTG